ncbi:MAG: sulfite exporter TauE/SafE family protein, partial [Xanthobacteraceae bacterium]
FAWGPLAGGTVGAGIILLSLLMAAGLDGAAVVATDAVISVGIGLTKLATFGLAGVVTEKVIAIALLIGVVAFPGAFLAKALIARLPVHLHSAILDAIVAGGGVAMIAHAFV